MTARCQQSPSLIATPPETHPTSILPSPAIIFPNVQLLPIKLRFREAAAYAVKLAATTVLPFLPHLLPCGHHHATTVYKINKKFNTID